MNRLRWIAVTVAVLLTGCGSSAASSRSSPVPVGPAASLPPSIGPTARASSGSSWNPPACADIPQAPVAAMLATTKVEVGSDSRADSVEETCVLDNGDAPYSARVILPTSTRDGFLGLTGSQESTGAKDFTRIDGFDEARLYDSYILIAQRGGRSVEIDASDVFPKPAPNLLVAVAHAIIDSPGTGSQPTTSPGSAATTTVPGVSPSTAENSASSPDSGISGAWHGSYQSAKSAAATSTFEVTFTQSGQAFTGTIEISSDCVATGTVSGHITGSTITFGAVHGAESVAFDGTITGVSAMHGTYRSGPSCGNDNGTWTATR